MRVSGQRSCTSSTRTRCSARAAFSDLYEAVAADALLDGGVLGEVTRDRHKHPKYAAKMATGTGKTWVLNALLVWQYLNKVASPTDERFTSNFLLVAPGLIVYDRLLDSFQGKDRRAASGTSRPATSTASRTFSSRRTTATQVFGFLQSSVVTKADIGRKVTGSRPDRDHQLAPARRCRRTPTSFDDDRRRGSRAGRRRQGSRRELLPADAWHSGGQRARCPRPSLRPWRSASGRSRTCPTSWSSTTRRTTSTRSARPAR